MVHANQYTKGTAHAKPKVAGAGRKKAGAPASVSADAARLGPKSRAAQLAAKAGGGGGSASGSGGTAPAAPKRVRPSKEQAAKNRVAREQMKASDAHWSGVAKASKARSQAGNDDFTGPAAQKARSTPTSGTAASAKRGTRAPKPVAEDVTQAPKASRVDRATANAAGAIKKEAAKKAGAKSSTYEGANAAKSARAKARREARKTYS